MTTSDEAITVLHVSFSLLLSFEVICPSQIMSHVHGTGGTEENEIKPKTFESCPGRQPPESLHVEQRGIFPLPCACVLCPGPSAGPRGAGRTRRRAAKTCKGRLGSTRAALCPYSEGSHVKEQTCEGWFPKAEERTEWK